ncbi:hypothetical protein KZZ52_43915 [Dactylosporangium sp. AC04546]|uniref:hypothetical protein n=1 Tax=Dactylosporangium sp. AC04546 TaxID=2862460 RepID=UPI001EDE1D88|nr:hypothetical protein [Dactylosporangium sp. AC04546]WVK80863.1 hypothetical protein KZZ52_43915 [Dactylosporangium sp. AC04546]
MTDKHSFGGLLHRATHRVPGVPAHVEQPAGHQGAAVHGRARRRGGAPRPSLNHRWNHSPARPPRFMAAWQRRIAAFFGRER